jgi:hypothetical protein
VEGRERNEQPDGDMFIGTFAGGEIPLHPAGDVGRNDWGNGQPRISAWEMFGSLFRRISDSSGVVFRPGTGPCNNFYTGRYLSVDPIWTAKHPQRIVGFWSICSEETELPEDKEAASRN